MPWGKLIEDNDNLGVYSVITAIFTEDNYQYYIINAVNNSIYLSTTAINPKLSHTAGTLKGKRDFQTHGEYTT